MDKKYGRAKNLSRLFQFNSVERAICTKVFRRKYLKKNVAKYLCYLQKFSVQGHIHEHYYTFEQFCIVSGFVFVALIYFFFIIKRQPLVGKTPIEIEPAVAKQTKKSVILFLSKHSASDNFLPPSKGYLKTYFVWSFGININFIYLNNP